MFVKLKLCVAVCGFYMMTAGVVGAQGGTYACVLSGGENVPILMDNTLKNVAVARRNSSTGQRTIVVNPKVMKLFQTPTRWFWLAHECAHHQLGHTLGNYGPNREQEADCYAAKQMVKSHDMTAADLKAIEDDISLIGGDKNAYLPGPARVQNIDECVMNQVKKELGQ